MRQKMKLFCFFKKKKTTKNRISDNNRPFRRTKRSKKEKKQVFLTVHLHSLTAVAGTEEQSGTGILLNAFVQLEKFRRRSYHLQKFVQMGAFIGVRYALNGSKRQDIHRNRYNTTDHSQIGQKKKLVSYCI